MAWGGGKRIKDATALPSDVDKGKVFYNNAGRQVGTGNISKIKSIMFPERSERDPIGQIGETWRGGESYRYYHQDEHDGMFINNYNDCGWGNPEYSEEIQLGIKYIVGVRLLNSFLPIALSSKEILQGGIYPWMYDTGSRAFTDATFAEIWADNPEDEHDFYNLFYLHENGSIYLPTYDCVSYELFYSELENPFI